jgi:hypothetical protein
MDDRRKYFRLAAHLPLDVVLPADSGKRLRRVSSNLSAGGVYFQGYSDDKLGPGQKINLRIAVPPGVGRTPRESTLEGQATILRIDPAPEVPSGLRSVGVACVFDTPLKFI